MHSYGRQAWTTKYSNGNLTKGLITNRIDFWSFNFQQTSKIEPFTIVPGDSLSTHGVYDTSKSNSRVYFGEPSDHEMLFDFLFVYPEENLNGIHQCGRGDSGKSVCDGNYLSEPNPAPDGNTSLPIIFGNAPATCSASKNISRIACVPTPLPTRSPVPTTLSPSRSPSFPTRSPTSPSKSPTTGSPTFAYIPVNVIDGTEMWLPRSTPYGVIYAKVGDRIRFSLNSSEYSVIKQDTFSLLDETSSKKFKQLSQADQEKVLNSYRKDCSSALSVTLVNGPAYQYEYVVDTKDANKLIMFTTLSESLCKQNMKAIAVIEPTTGYNDTTKDNSGSSIASSSLQFHLVIFFLIGSIISNLV